jgi:hypothetical protein
VSRAPATLDFLGCMVQPSRGQRPGAGPGNKERSKVVVVPHKRQCRLHHQAKNMVSVLIHAYLGLQATVLIHVKLAIYAIHCFNHQVQMVVLIA